MACERWLETPGSSASMPATAGVRAGTPGSATLCAGLVELAARDEPAWLVARRQPAQNALGILHSLAKLSGKVRRARAGRIGRDGALNATMSSPVGSPAAGSRGAPLDGRLLPTLSTASSASLLSLRPPPGACADRLASPQRCLHCDTHVGSPPASPAAGPHSAPLVGGVPRRLWSAGCLAQTAADAVRGRRRRCCRAPALWASGLG